MGNALRRKIGGTPAAANTAKHTKAAINEVFGTPVERVCFQQKPLTGLRWSLPDVADEVDPDWVPNPEQVARLLEAVRVQKGRSPHRLCFFGRMYYVPMR